MKKIYLYTDYVFNSDVLRARLFDATGCDILSCDADDILNGILDETVDLFVMPGGADLYLCEKLDGQGNTLIRTYVENGGRYLGICSGAYYACESLKFARHIPDQEISGTRELAFHKGCAIGPILNYIPTPNMSEGLDGICALSGEWGDVRCLYRGGPSFEEGYGETVLMRYDDLESKSPAIIETAIGQGKVVLCGPHPEQRSNDFRKMIYRHKNKNYDYMSRVASDMEPYDEEANALWKKLVERALI